MAIFGRNKVSTIAQPISMSMSTLNLPRNSVHDAYILKFNLTVANNSSAPYTPEIKNVLKKAITDIRLVTDSIRVHYALNGYDLALLNSRVQKTQANDTLGMTFEEIPAGEHVDLTFALYLDEGDIVAPAHNNVELSIQFGGEIDKDIIVATANCVITLKETIYSGAQLESLYGESWERVVEPKVYALTDECAGNTEFSGFMEIPNGTLLRGAVVDFTPADGETYPELIGLLRTVPDRVELGKEDWFTHRAIDEIIYETTFPKGCVIYDFGTQWQSNRVGKDGWSFAKGDIELAAKSEVKQAIRYISLESLVNIPLYKQMYAFTTY
ncbi:hypothetical protein J6C36_03725 [Methanocorpusculaceae archaeon]|nr:hypothetical protein [Methanocorpusculaceae archaeon]MBO5368596.1 hypothetical protein [Methanocorpusculum sp.]MBP3443100.1 hypothetical protein [Methanocorpusculaceae archaeon]